MLYCGRAALAVRSQKRGGAKLLHFLLRGVLYENSSLSLNIQFQQWKSTTEKSDH